MFKLLNETSVHAQDLAAFGRLGESKQSIESAIGTVHQGLIGVQGLVEQVVVLRADLTKSFEEYRKIALESSAIRQERDQFQQQLAEKSEHYKVAHAALASLQTEAEDARRNYEFTRTGLEALEHRHHLLGVAKRETEDQLDRYVSQLAVANEEVDNLRLEVSSLQETIETSGPKIADLTAKCNDSNSQIIFLTNQCEALENAVQKKSDEMIAANEKYDLMYQEKQSAVLYSHQKEQEATHARAEMTRLFEEGQHDKKIRDSAINKLKSEIDHARAKLRMLDEVHFEVAAENERLTLQVRRSDDLAKQSNTKAARLETIVGRLNTKLETTIEAKVHTEQSRATITARLEAMTQLLEEREAGLKERDEQVARLTSQAEQERDSSQDTIESLGLKVFELEKELTAQRNQTAFYASQLDAAQRSATVRKA
jgi:chromosome segregation ATPase